MNQKILCHFEIMFKEKYFQFSFQPGVVIFEDIYGALEAFKEEVDKLKVLALEQEAKQRAEAESNKSEDLPS